MSESIERPTVDLDPPEAPDRDLDAMLDRLGAPEAGERHDPDGADAIRIPPDERFLAWHRAQGDAGPQRYERPGDRLPWTEHPGNPALERYDWHPDLERAVQDAYAEHGFDAETVRRVNAIDAEKGGGANCGECARSVASTLDGCPRAAAALDRRRHGESTTEMEAWAGRPFGEAVATDPALDAIDRDLAARGDGAHGIVFGGRELGTGHYLNLARIDGRTVVIDAQPGAEIHPLEAGGRAYVHDQQLTTLRWLPLERNANA